MSKKYQVADDPANVDIDYYTADLTGQGAISALRSCSNASNRLPISAAYPPAWLTGQLESRGPGSNRGREPDPPC